MTQTKIVAASLYDISAEQRLNLLVDCLEEYSIYLIDPDGYIVSWSDGARKNKGYSAQEVIGCHFSIFFSVEDKDQHLPERLLQRALRHGRAESEGWRVRKGGARFWGTTNIYAVRNPDGQLLGFAKITKNRTEKLARDALRRARDAAVIECEAKTELLARISHELRTPLNAVIGYAQAFRMLFDDLSDSKKREYIEIINHSADSLGVLVNDIWDKHAKSAATVVMQESVPLGALLADVACEFERASPEPIRLARLAEELGARGDRERIAQILRNFIANALKYAGARPRIRIGARFCAPGFAEICVDDDGPGVPQGQQKAVFERYYRLENQSDGLGFGLWYCRELALRMKGEIGCGRSPMGGARFWVRLPAAAPSPAQTQTDPRPPALGR